MSNELRKSVPTFEAEIYVGLRQGYTDIEHTLTEVERCCIEYCQSVKLCVSVTPTRFIYVGGDEPGAIVSLINYPRFPTTVDVIKAQAVALAEMLRLALGQHRVSVVCSDETIMIGDVS